VVVLSATANAEEMLVENTINTGIMLIGEGSLLPESLRFESEPWTFFYMAGGIIRQLRKALENKKGQRPSTKERYEEGGVKDDRYQRSNLTQTSDCRPE